MGRSSRAADLNFLIFHFFLLLDRLRSIGNLGNVRIRVGHWGFARRMHVLVRLFKPLSPTVLRGESGS